MKKFNKVILGMFSFCLMLGVAFLIIGFALGGKFSDMNVNVTDFSEIIKAGRGNQNGEAVSIDKADLKQNYATKLNQEENLDISLKQGTIIVKQTSGSKLEVSGNGTASDFAMKEEKNTIIIADQRKWSTGLKKIQLVVLIPENYELNQVSIEARGCDVKLEDGLVANDFSMKCGAGNIELNNLQIKNKLEMSIGAGDATLNNCNLNQMKLNCGAGSLDFDGKITGDSKIACGAGDVELKLEQSLKLYNYKLDSGIGDIHIGDRSYSGIANTTTIDNGSSATFTLQAGIGDIDITGK